MPKQSGRHILGAGLRQKTSTYHSYASAFVLAHHPKLCSPALLSGGKNCAHSAYILCRTSLKAAPKKYAVWKQAYLYPTSAQRTLSPIHTTQSLLTLSLIHI